MTPGARVIKIRIECAVGQVQGSVEVTTAGEATRLGASVTVVGVGTGRAVTEGVVNE